MFRGTNPDTIEFILNIVIAVIFATIIILLGYTCILQNELLKEIMIALPNY